MLKVFLIIDPSLLMYEPGPTMGCVSPVTYMLFCPLALKRFSLVLKTTWYLRFLARGWLNV